jgi:hypothetical protein
MSAVKAGAYPKVLHSGKLLALSTNIRLSWKGLPGTNALAYYQNSSITEFFYNIGHRADIRQASEDKQGEE